MNIYVRYCLKCGQAYDVETQYDLCRDCRRNYALNKIRRRLKPNGKANMAR